MKLPIDTSAEIAVPVALPATAVPLPKSMAGTPPASPALQQRFDRALALAGPRIRYELMRVGPAGLAGLASCAAAAVAALVLLLPAHRSVLSLDAEVRQAGHARPAAATPDQTPRQFAAALPSRAEVPALLGVLLVQAADAGIVLDQGRYTFFPAASNRLAHYTIEFPVKSDYANVRVFINKSLAAIPALGLDKLHVERKNVGETQVSADVGFVIYLRGA